MLRSGGPWKDLPQAFPSESTCRRRLREWAETGVLVEVWSQLIELSDGLGWVDWEHLIADGTFCRARKGGLGRCRLEGQEGLGFRVDGQRPHAAEHGHRPSRRI